MQHELRKLKYMNYAKRNTKIKMNYERGNKNNMNYKNENVEKALLIQGKSGIEKSGKLNANVKIQNTSKMRTPGRTRHKTPKYQEQSMCWP